MPFAFLKSSVTAVVLAGGRATRMGGLDKGLQLFNGVPLAQHALQRLAPQVGHLVVSANRNLPAYEAFGVPVWPDDNTLGDFAGPLAGVITGLKHCTTRFLLTVPCDAPLFPVDLAVRLAAGLVAASAQIAVASAPESHGLGKVMRKQPVFSLMEADILQSLLDYTYSGGRKVSDWMAAHQVAQVAFNQSHDVPNAFFNANTLADLKQIQVTTNTEYETNKPLAP